MALNRSREPYWDGWPKRSPKGWPYARWMKQNDGAEYMTKQALARLRKKNKGVSRLPRSCRAWACCHRACRLFADVPTCSLPATCAQAVRRRRCARRCAKRLCTLHRRRPGQCRSRTSPACVAGCSRQLMTRRQGDQKDKGIGLPPMRCCAAILAEFRLLGLHGLRLLQSSWPCALPRLSVAEPASSHWGARREREASGFDHLEFLCILTIVHLDYSASCG